MLTDPITGLTPKQSAFCREYTKDFNGSQAAIRAGYSERSSRSTSSEFLTNPNIKAEIKRLVDEKAMKEDEILLILSDIGRGDMGEMLDISDVSFNLDLAGAKRKGLTHLIRKVKQVTKISTSKDGGESETTIQEVELYSKLEAIQKIMDIRQMVIKRTDITTQGEKITDIGVKAVDYRAGLAALAPGSMGDSEAPGEGESSGNGPEMG